MKRFSGVLVAFVTFISMYMLAKMELYRQIEGNMIFVVFMGFSFLMVGYFLPKIFSSSKKNKLPKKGKTKPVVMEGFDIDRK